MQLYINPTNTTFVPEKSEHSGKQTNGMLYVKFLQSTDTSMSSSTTCVSISGHGR